MILRLVQEKVKTYTKSYCSIKKSNGLSENSLPTHIRNAIYQEQFEFELKFGNRKALQAARKPDQQVHRTK